MAVGHCIRAVRQPFLHAKCTQIEVETATRENLGDKEVHQSDKVFPFHATIRLGFDNGFMSRLEMKETLQESLLDCVVGKRKAFGAGSNRFSEREYLTVFAASLPGEYFVAKIILEILFELA